MNENAILDRVRKLLAKAERAGSPEEAETYTAKAVELMTRHGIDEALAHAAEPERKADPIGGTRVTISDPYSAGKARLLGWTATALGCRWIMHGARQGKVASVTIFGHQSDRERAELLYTSLLLQVARPLQTVRPSIYSDESVSAYRRSWLYGYAARIHERMKAAQDTAVAESEASGTGAELVLADRRTAVERAHAEAFPNLRKGRAPSLSGTGYGAGARAANRADLGQTRVRASGENRTALGA